MDVKIKRHINKGEIVYGKPSVTHHFYLGPWTVESQGEIDRWCAEHLRGKWMSFPEMIPLAITSSEAVIHINCREDSDAMLVKLSF